MDEELHRYVLQASRLPDSPPSVHPDTPLSDVSWKNDDQFTPTSASFSFVTSELINSENNRGNRLQPCLKPHATLNGLLRSSPTFTSQLTSAYTAFKKAVTRPPIPIPSKQPHNFP